LRRVDRKGGNRTANIEKMTEAKHVVSLNPPRISLFPGEFFNNIGRLPSAKYSGGRALEQDVVNSVRIERRVEVDQVD
jgi:hypothetical protein